MNKKVVKQVITIAILIVFGVVFIKYVSNKGFQEGFDKGFLINDKCGEMLENNKKGEFTCPYEVDSHGYSEYSRLANEISVSWEPEFIEDAEVIKLDEPFNLTEFEKELYKIGDDKGWDERNFDVDDDGKDERIISADVAMNHTPNIAMIVKDGKIVFRADGANVSIGRAYEDKGFTLYETIDWNTGETELTRYIPKDGGFLPVWVQRSCWVTFK